MSGSISDCYLCGARNDPHEKFCVRCNGQLLRLAPEPDPLDMLDELDLDTETSPDGLDGLDGLDARADLGEDVEKAKARRWRKGSVEDQRLSDALGLSDDEDILDDDLLDTVVTSIPRATPATEMPMIGTRPGAIPQGALQPTEASRRTYVLLGLLLLATVWLGYTTIIGGSGSPDNLAYSVTTTSSTSSTTTTEAPRREWSLTEVDGRYRTSFIRAELFECSLVTGEGGNENLTTEATAIGSGVAVDRFNAILDVSALPTANVARLVSRSGAARLAMLERDPVTGLMVATTPTATSRDLRLGDDPEGETTYYLHFDPETNAVQTSRTPIAGVSQITTTNFGDVESVRIGGRVIDHDELITIDRRVEFTGAVKPKDASACSKGLGLEPIIEDDTQDGPLITNGVEDG